MAQIISVHSFRDGTGKSFLTANLGTIFAIKGFRVGIMDANFGAPGLHCLFGLDEDVITYPIPTVNGYLWGHNDIKDTPIDIIKRLDPTIHGNLYFFPVNFTAGDIARIYRFGYVDEFLIDGLHELANFLDLDFLLIETRTGIWEHTLRILDISNMVIEVMRPDAQDYQIVASNLGYIKYMVPKLLLIVNQIPPSYDFEAVNNRVSNMYHCDVGAILPHSYEILTIASSCIFSHAFPDHEITNSLKHLGDKIISFSFPYHTKFNSNEQEQETEFGENITSSKYLPSIKKPEDKENAIPEIRTINETQQELDELFNELNSLIGLERVKFEVRKLIQFAKIQKLRQEEGLGSINLSLHSVFYGSPGTGKTTVARIYGKMLKAIGLLQDGHLVETDRAGLVANYIGQTANKTDEKVEEAIGGVLFIDEAYSLYKGEDSQWDFGSESIEILMKRMEDNRSNLAVIVAGYPEPMDRFLNSNEGFKSRFANHVHFDDYTPEELLRIFLLLCNQNNYKILDSTVELIKKVILDVYENKNKSFGNARFCRNIFEKAIRNQALRVGEMQNKPTISQLTTIEEEDILPLLSDKGTSK